MDLKSGYYWAKISEGWRIIEVDLSQSVHSGGDYYHHGVQAPQPLRKLNGCKIMGPIRDPADTFTYQHPVIRYEAEAA